MSSSQLEPWKSYEGKNSSRELDVMRDDTSDGFHVSSGLWRRITFFKNRFPWSLTAKLLEGLVPTQLGFLQFLFFSSGVPGWRFLFWSWCWTINKWEPPWQRFQTLYTLKRLKQNKSFIQAWRKRRHKIFFFNPERLLEHLLFIETMK